MFSLLTGLKYLHQHKVIHGSIKPSNVVINDDFTIKLSNFAEARIFSGEKQSDST